MQNMKSILLGLGAFLILTSTSFQVQANQPTIPDPTTVEGANYACLSKTTDDDVVYFLKTTLPNKVWQSSLKETLNTPPMGLELDPLYLELRDCPHCVTFKGDMGPLKISGQMSGLESPLADGTVSQLKLQITSDESDNSDPFEIELGCIEL